MTDCSVPGELPESVDSSEDMPGELRMPAMHQSAATEDNLHLVPCTCLFAMACLLKLGLPDVRAWPEEKTGLVSGICLLCGSQLPQGTACCMHMSGHCGLPNSWVWPAEGRGLSAEETCLSS